MVEVGYKIKFFDEDAKVRPFVCKIYRTDFCPKDSFN